MRCQIKSGREFQTSNWERPTLEWQESCTLVSAVSCHLMTDAKILALTCVIDIGLAGVELMTITVVHRKWSAAACWRRKLCTWWWTVWSFTTAARSFSCWKVCTVLWLFSRAVLTRGLTLFSQVWIAVPAIWPNTNTNKKYNNHHFTATVQVNLHYLAPPFFWCKILLPASPP